MAYVYTGDYNYDYGLGAYGVGAYGVGAYGLADYGLNTYALGNYALAAYGIGNYSTYLPYCNAPVAVDSAIYQPRHFQEVYYSAEPPPQIQVVRQRLPEPPPDVIERVVVMRQPQQYVYQVVEVPKKPPPVIQERVVQQAPKQPVCGGTYRVHVPHSANPPLPRIARSASSIQVLPTRINGVIPTQINGIIPTHINAVPSVQTSVSYIQPTTSYIQPTTSYIQPSTSFVQTRPSVIQTVAAPDSII
jgi:hypothetical protein